MNEVKITVDDQTKTLRFEEALTSGSKYRVAVEGGAATCGAAGSLVLMDRGELVAYAELTRGNGELSTNTREMEKALKRMPVGASLDFDAVLHKADDAEGENVAVGICRVVASGGAWTDDTTGALTLYRGEKGAMGATGATGPQGMSAYEVAVANGYKGSVAQWLASLKGETGALGYVQLLDGSGNATLSYCKVYCKEIDGERVLVLDQDATEDIGDADGSEVSEFVTTDGDQTITGSKTISSTTTTFTNKIVLGSSGRIAMYPKSTGSYDYEITFKGFVHLEGGQGVYALGSVTAATLTVSNKSQFLDAATFSGAVSLGGSATAETKDSTDRSTSVATTEFVQKAINAALGVSADYIGIYTLTYNAGSRAYVETIDALKGDSTYRLVLKFNAPKAEEYYVEGTKAYFEAGQNTYTISSFKNSYGDRTLILAFYPTADASSSPDLTVTIYAVNS